MSSSIDISLLQYAKKLNFAIIADSAKRKVEQKPMTMKVTIHHRQLYTIFMLLSLPFLSFTQDWGFVSPEINNYSSPKIFQSPDNHSVLLSKNADNTFRKATKIDEAGNQIWSINLVDGNIASMLSNGDIIVTGTMVTRYDQAGNSIWTENAEGIFSTSTATNDGGFSFAGYDDDQVFLNKYSSDNLLEWSTEISVIPSGLGFRPESLKQLTNGNFILTGYNQGKAESNTILVDAAGNELWNHTISSSEGIGFNVDKVMADSEGNIIAGGTALIPSPGLPRSIVIDKVDPTGQAVWQQVISIESDDAFGDMVVMPDGSTIVTGWSDEVDDPSDGMIRVFLFKLDKDGVKQWQNEYEVPFDWDYFDPSNSVPRLFQFGDADIFHLCWYRDHPLSGDFLPSVYNIDLSGTIIESFDLFHDQNDLYHNGKAYEMLATNDGSFVLAGLIRSENNSFNQEQVFIAKRQVLISSDSEANILIPNNWTIYPNPASDLLCVTSKNFRGEVAIFQLFDVLGRVVGNWDIIDKNRHVNLNLNSGNYFYRIQVDEQIIDKGMLLIK